MTKHFKIDWNGHLWIRSSCSNLSPKWHRTPAAMTAQSVHLVILHLETRWDSLPIIACGGIQAVFSFCYFPTYSLIFQFIPLFSDAYQKSCTSSSSEIWYNFEHCSWHIALSWGNLSSSLKWNTYLDVCPLATTAPLRTPFLFSEREYQVLRLSWIKWTLSDLRLQTVTLHLVLVVP